MQFIIIKFVIDFNCLIISLSILITCYLLSNMPKFMLYMFLLGLYSLLDLSYESIP